MKPPTVPIRTVYTYVRFTPEGPDKGDQETFFDFYLAATERIQRNRARELACKRRESKQFIEAMDKLSPLIRVAIRGGQPDKTIPDKAKELVPDENLRRKLRDHYLDWLKNTPEDKEQQKSEQDRETSDIVRSDRLHKARKAIYGGLKQLSEATHDGNAEAAEYLAEAATFAAGLLSIAEKAKPELIKPLARRTILWPVMAGHEPGWEKAAMQRMADLDLGADFLMKPVRFRKARGTDANLPARRWAKAAVRVVEETRKRKIMVAGIILGFGTSEAFADFFVMAGWEFGDEPGWAKSVENLKPFSKVSLPDWKPVVREMIRDQMPDFHNLPEWQTQRNTAEASGKTTKGEVRNAILDDIMSALARLAPESPC